MERTIDAAYFRRLSGPFPLVFVAAVALYFSLAMPTSARADEGDALLVLPTGPARNAQVLGLSDASGETQVVDLGEHRLLDAAIGAAPIRDLKILPDGRNLLTDVGGRGVLISNADGQAEFSLSGPGERLRISSASVSAYAAPGEVARLLITDSNRSQAFVIDPRNPDARLAWIQGFSLPGSRADFVEAIALPEQRAAVAVNWTTLGISAIDIYETQSGAPNTRLRRLAGATQPNQPSDSEIVPDIKNLRDVMGLPNGNLLVTTQFTLFEMSLEGVINWKVTLGQGASGLGGASDNQSTDAAGDAATTTLSGEFSSATLLPSGRIALATLQPGVWTAPHINHRVYWLSASALENSEIQVVARSEALDFAPAHIESRTGNGASGSFGFRPGLDVGDSGPLSDLEATRELSLSQPNYTIGELIRGFADLENTGSDPVALSRLTVLINAGACGAQTDTSIALYEGVALEIAPQETFLVRGNREVDAAFSPGRWCARLHAQNSLGDRVELGAPVGFDILEPGADSGSTIDIEDLEFWGAADAGNSPQDTSGPEVPQPDVNEGCGCASTPAGTSPTRLPGGAIALFVLGAMSWMRRQASA